MTRLSNLRYSRGSRATFHGSRKTRAAASGVLQVTTHNPKGYEPKEAALLRLDSHVNAAASTLEW